MDLRPFYFNALDNASRIVAGVKPEQLSEPTPCEGWNGRELLNHLIGGVLGFTLALNGEKVDPSGEIPDLVGDDASASFDQAKKAAVEAWSEPDALERTVFVGSEMPATIGLRVALMEAIVHGWDVAKATGQEHGMDPMVSTAMLDGLRKMITDDQRGPGQVFGAQVEIGDDAPIQDQLVAFLGRTP